MDLQVLLLFYEHVGKALIELALTVEKSLFLVSMDGFFRGLKGYFEELHVLETLIQYRDWLKSRS